MITDEDRGDNRGYLLTEMRIIAENDTHAVLAIRLDKSWIARNLPVLSALADLAPPTVPADPIDIRAT